MADFPVLSPCPNPHFPLKTILGIIGGILALLILGLTLVVIYLIKKSKDQGNQGRVVTVVRSLRLQISPQKNRIRQQVEKDNRKSLSFIPTNKVKENIQFFETVALEELEAL
jgi:CDP-diglyceride synthetase